MVTSQVVLNVAAHPASGPGIRTDTDEEDPRRIGIKPVSRRIVEGRHNGVIRLDEKGEVHNCQGPDLLAEWSIRRKVPICPGVYRLSKEVYRIGIVGQIVVASAEPDVVKRARHHQSLRVALERA
jgi:hypothetical protein